MKSEGEINEQDWDFKTIIILILSIITSLSQMVTNHSPSV
jgi:hypothetical protein